MCIMCVTAEYVTLDDAHTHTLNTRWRARRGHASAPEYLAVHISHMQTTNAMRRRRARTRVRRTCRAAFVVHDTYVYYMYARNQPHIVVKC